MAWLYLGELPRGTAPGDIVELVGEEARHAVQVARTRVGERIAIGDGAGRVVSGPVTGVRDGRLELEVDAFREDPRPSPELWLVQALAKGDRDELAVQAATELGVSGVVPWQAVRSVSRWSGAKVERGVERWRSIAREAAKQSIRSWLPEVTAPATTAGLAGLPGLVVVLEPTAEVALTGLELPASGRISLVVGPEGGIAPGELDALSDAGAAAARLGPEVLRTSTAGPAALAALAVRLGRW